MGTDQCMERGVLGGSFFSVSRHFVEKIKPLVSPISSLEQVKQSPWSNSPGWPHLLLRPLGLAQSWGVGKKKPMERWQLLCSHSHHFRIRLDIRKEEILYCADGEALEQAAQRSSGAPFLEVF